MMERNHGHIVAMSSMAGVVGLRNLVPYCATKFAVRGLMEALHEELREDPRDYSGVRILINFFLFFYIIWVYFFIYKKCICMYVRRNVFNFELSPVLL